MGAPASSVFFVTLDGFDGVGKSTLTRGLEREFAALGYTVGVIDRSPPRTTAPVATLATLIKRSDGHLDPLTEDSDALIRLACSRERIAAGRMSDADIIILDRWLVWDLSRIGQAPYSAMRGLIEQVIADSPGLALFLELDFDVSWSRMESRQEPLSPREALGVEHNRALHAKFELGIERFEVCGERDVVVLDASATRDQVLQQATAHIRSGLKEN